MSSTTLKVMCYGKPEMLRRPCVDCGRITGNFCDFDCSAALRGFMMLSLLLAFGLGALCLLLLLALEPARPVKPYFRCLLKTTL